MAQVRSQKHSKLTHTFAKRDALKSVLAQSNELAAAIEAFATSKHEALTAALRAALQSGFARSNLHLGGARHGVVVLRQPPRSPSGDPACTSATLLRVCQATLAGSAVTVHLVSAEDGAAHACNLLQRATASTETLLLVIGQPQLEELLDLAPPADLAHSGASPQPTGSSSAWRFLSFVFEYDQLSESLQLAAQSHGHLTTFNLRPANGPVVNHATDGGVDKSLAGTFDGTLDDSPLAAMAMTLREAHGCAYDELIDVTALMRTEEPVTSCAASAVGYTNCASSCNGSTSTRRPHRADVSSPVLMGEELLRYPKLHSLLRRKGLTLIETSTALPHLILE